MSSRPCTNMSQAANSRDFDQVAPIVADNAVYWFSDGEFEGLDAIRRAFEMTWNTIEHERYAIEDVQWVVVGDRAAVCIYQFRSEGFVRGAPVFGNRSWDECLRSNRRPMENCSRALDSRGESLRRWLIDQIDVSRRLTA